MFNYEFPIFDVHSHVQFPIFDGDREEVIKRAKESGVKIIAVGTQASTSKRAIEIAREFPGNVWATVGFHPGHLAKNWHHDKKEQTESRPENFDIEILRKLAKDSKVAAIGECGFDFYRLTTDNQQLTTIKDLQKEVFTGQAELAVEMDKPLMMHCRPAKGTDDAYEYASEILRDGKYNSLKKIMHFYAGSLEMTKRLSNSGFYFTFGGAITFSDNYDEILKYLPLNRIFLETDCPYVAPKSHRGKRNEPAFILETAGKLAEIKRISFGKMAEELYENSIKTFKIN